MSSIIPKDAADALDRMVAYLGQGAVAIMPCDTIYGIVGKVPETQHAIQSLKGRDQTKPFIQLATVAMVRLLSRNPLDEKLVAYWPGPLTAIVWDRGGNSLALRVPNDPFLLTIIERLGVPLYSTSVNISGEEPLLQFSEIYQRFCDLVPVFLQGDEEAGTVPSTIIDVRSKPYTLVRKGALDVTELLAK